MIFSIQRFVEDYLKACGLSGGDQYAVALANLYDHSRVDKNEQQFLLAMRRIRTTVFRANANLNRANFEKSLLKRLDTRFKKKLRSDNPTTFPGGVVLERARILKAKRKSINGLLKEFKHAVESKAIDTFWVSRKRGQLRPKPEKIAQGLLAMFAKGAIGDSGVVLRELVSGIGFVDVSIILSARTPHLIELKILKDGLIGPNQLATYMKTERRQEGWLALVDVRVQQKKSKIPKDIATPHGTIKTLVIDVNPTAPSKN